MTEFTKVEHIALALTSALVSGAMEDTLAEGAASQENQNLIKRTVEVYQAIFKTVLHEVEKPQG